ncbi:hypothetical protein COHCIP112018_05112 [Cohnella sp. JJ-181]|nr:hypothetical protein COHCIP112018_05112 [Cohnella sp. JJ-181]
MALVDSAGKIVKWADVAVEERNVAGTPPVVEPYIPPASSDDGVAIIVDGSTRERTATASVTTVDGKKTTLVSVVSRKIGAALAEAAQGYVITIPVANQSDIVIGELDAQTVKNMEDKQAVLEVKTEKAGYTLPAAQIDVSAIASKLGTNVALSDIKIRVEIANVPAQDVKFTPTAGEKFQIVAPAADFSIKAVYQGREVTVDKFNAYVERRIAIPDGIDPSKITTGVVVLEDGSVLHVPTKVTQVDGRYYAVINSLTNSVYSVIYNLKTFADIAGHWARASIEDMASRLVVNGGADDKYLPDEAITRAEFAAMMVRALGLHAADEPASFSDVAASDWYAGAVSIASAYGLLQGYPDGTFGPSRSISRQEAMSIAARAMKIAGLDTAIASDQRSRWLAAFGDAGQVGEWAKEAAALNVKHGVIGGNAGLIRPQAPITRAETAAVVQRLLRQADLIQ